jgi:hypothetical protein
MKSAYELAMERLQKESPVRPLTEEQKAALAEVDSLFRAKLAERELFLKDKIAKAQAAGQLGDVLELEKELQYESRRIQEECETRKNRIREGRE